MIPRSLILGTATRFIMALLLVFSLFLLYRGHDEPGGGFIAGLVGALAFALHAMADGVASARRSLQVEPVTLVALGLLIATAAGVLAMAGGAPFLTGLWTELPLGDGYKLGSPLLFDIGVYLVVVGVTLAIIFAVAEA